jgi:signal peptidase I
MAQRIRELVLWAGAALGLLAVAAGLAVAFGGFSFLIFRSGSMSPEIPTGGIALARTVDASDLRAGDVVSVTAASGERITHRVVSSTVRDGAASLVLKGDANATEDSEVYVVTSAERVVGSVPYGGYVVAHALTPPGLVALGALSLMLILLTGGRREDDDPDPSDPTTGPRSRGGRHVARTSGRAWGRRSAAAVAVGAAATVAITGTGGTLAAFTDRPTAASGTFAATSIATPTLPDPITQATGTGAAPISWAQVRVGDTTAARYDIVRYTQATGGTGTVVCEDVTTLSCTEPKPASAASNTTYHYAVRARYATNWTAESATRRSYTPDVIVPGGNYSTPVLTACTSAQLACGTATDTGGGTVARVEYSLLRERTILIGLVTTYQCWNGTQYVNATNNACPTFYQATGTTSWSVPGNKSTAYAPAAGGTNDYTLVIRLIDSYGNVRTSSPITYSN